MDYIHINCTNAKPDTLIIYAGWATEKIYGFLKNAPVQRAKLQNSKPLQKHNYGFRLGHVHIVAPNENDTHHFSNRIVIYRN